MIDSYVVCVYVTNGSNVFFSLGPRQQKKNVWIKTWEPLIFFQYLKGYHLSLNADYTIPTEI